MVSFSILGPFGPLWLRAGLEKDKGEIRKELEKVRKENNRRTAAHAQNAAGARAAELAQKVNDCDDQLRQRAEALEERQREANELRSGLADLEEADRAAREQEKDARAEADDDKRHLSMLESTARNPLAAFGDYQQRLSDEVQKASRSFSRKPVGPIGAHVTLRRKEDKKWGVALGEIVGRHLSNWIVATPADRSALLSIARKLRCDARLTIIIQKPRARHNVRKPPSQTSMLDLLNVDDDACFNALVDMARADVTCVFEDKAEAESKGMTQNRGVWSHAPGVESLVLRDGSITGAKKGNLYVKRPSARKGVALGVDASKDIPAAKRASQASQKRHKDAATKAKSARAAFDKAQKADSNAIREIDRAKKAHTKAERDAREAKAQHREVQDKADEAVVLDDTTALEDDLADMEREIRNAKETLCVPASFDRDAVREASRESREIDRETTRGLLSRRRHRYRSQVPEGQRRQGRKGEDAALRKSPRGRARCPVSQRFGGPPRFHAIDAPRLQERRRWVVSFSILRPFGPRRFRPHRIS